MLDFVEKTIASIEADDQLSTDQLTMEFLSGIYQISTGKEFQKGGNQNIEIDRTTGEVVMRFKIDL